MSREREPDATTAAVDAAADHSPRRGSPDRDEHRGSRDEDRERHRDGDRERHNDDRDGRSRHRDRERDEEVRSLFVKGLSDDTRYF